MNLFYTLIDQMQMMKLPLYAVTLTAVPRADTPLLLMLHWHGFRKQATPALPQLKPIMQPVPGSALQINTRWQQPEVVEEAVLDAAWQLGAWDVQREEHRGCNTVGASEQEALACKQAFGCYDGLGADTVLPEALLISDAPDQEAMLDLGARIGYVRWQFRPVNGGLWDTTAEDDTLLENGRRIPPCPIRPLALKGWTTKTGPTSKTAYRLGQINRIILLK